MTDFSNIRYSNGMAVAVLVPITGATNALRHCSAGVDGYGSAWLRPSFKLIEGVITNIGVGRRGTEPQVNEISVASRLFSHTGGSPTWSGYFAVSNAYHVQDALSHLNLNTHLNAEQKAFAADYLLPRPVATPQYAALLRDIAAATNANLGALTLQSVLDVRRRAEELGFLLMTEDERADNSGFPLSPATAGLMTSALTSLVAGDPIELDVEEEEDEGRDY